MIMRGASVVGHTCRIAVIRSTCRIQSSLVSYECNMRIRAYPQKSIRMFNLILRVRIHFRSNTESVSVGDSDTLNEIKQQAYRSCAYRSCAPQTHAKTHARSFTYVTLAAKCYTSDESFDSTESLAAPTRRSGGTNTTSRSARRSYDTTASPC